MKRECSELQVAFSVEPVNVPHTGVLICGHPSRLLMVIALERLLMAGSTRSSWLTKAVNHWPQQTNRDCFLGLDRNGALGQKLSSDAWLRTTDQGWLPTFSEAI